MPAAPTLIRTSLGSISGIGTSSKTTGWLKACIRAARITSSFINLLAWQEPATAKITLRQRGIKKTKVHVDPGL